MKEFMKTLCVKRMTEYMKTPYEKIMKVFENSLYVDNERVYGHFK